MCAFSQHRAHVAQKVSFCNSAMFSTCIRANKAHTSFARAWTEPLGLILWKLWVLNFTQNSFYTGRQHVLEHYWRKEINYSGLCSSCPMFILRRINTLALCAIAWKQVTYPIFFFQQKLEKKTQDKPKPATSCINTISLFEIVNCCYFSHGYIAVNVYAHSFLQQNSCSSNHKLLFSGVVETQQQKTRDWSVGSDDQFIQD